MMTTTDNERRDIEALLPWHAAGTLGRRDAQRDDAALENDEELARQFALVREELGETIHLNETLGAPSARAMDRLLAGIEAEGSRARKSRFSFDVGAFLAERLAVFTPRTLAWSGIAATLAIVLQAGLLADIYVGRGGGGTSYETASYQKSSDVAPGDYAYVRFAPQASVGDITSFLETRKMSVVEGPKTGGIYTIRVSVTGLPKAELDRVLKRMEEDSKLVQVIGPVTPKQ